MPAMIRPFDPEDDPADLDPRAAADHLIDDHDGRHLAAAYAPGRRPAPIRLPQNLRHALICYGD